MTLILLAISLSIALCVIAYNFAIYALPFMVGLTAFQYTYGTDAGFLMSGFAAIAGYALVYGFTKNAIDSTIVLNPLGGAGGLFIGIAAMLNLNALGTAVFSR